MYKHIYIYSATLTWTVWSVWRVGWLPDAVVGTEVAVDSILSEAIAVFTVESTVDSFLLFRTDELSIHWDVRLVTRCPWADTHNAPPWFSQVGAQCLITSMHDCTMKLKNSGTAKGHWHWCFVLFTVYFILITQDKKKRERVPWGAGTSLRCRGALIPWTVTVRLHVRLFPAASVAVYCTTVSPTGNREPGLWRLVTVRRPPERQTERWLFHFCWPFLVILLWKSIIIWTVQGSSIRWVKASCECETQTAVFRKCASYPTIHQ